MRFVSTRDGGLRSSFSDALLHPAAPDGGLWFPEPIACFRDLSRLLDMPFLERAVEILVRLLGDEFRREDLAAVTETAFDFPVPVVEVRDRIFALELFHGPSFAFKDFGARFLASVLERLLPDARPRTILTATSGDTGAAAALAFGQRPGFQVVVLYPKGRVSPLQEHQFAALGGNVRAFAVEGSFDDCHAMVRTCLADAGLARQLNFVSANSLNVARLIAQVPYYFEAVARVRDTCFRDAPVIAVPCGNFGDLFAGLWAQRMGLPVKAFVVATNLNSAVPGFLETGTWRARPSVPTLSNAMDVTEPSNWERVLRLFPAEGDGTTLAAMRRALRWGALTDEETKKALWELNGAGYRADPHGAVAFGVLQERLGLNETGIFLATAHPAKFKPMLDEMGIDVATPPNLAQVLARPIRAESIPANLGALMQALGL